LPWVAHSDLHDFPASLYLPDTCGQELQGRVRDQRGDLVPGRLPPDRELPDHACEKLVQSVKGNTKTKIHNANPPSLFLFLCLPTLAPCQNMAGVKDILDMWGSFEDKDFDVESLVRVGSGRSELVWTRFGHRIAGGQLPLSDVVEQLGPWLTHSEQQSRAAGTGFLSLLLAQLSNPSFHAAAHRIPQVAGLPCPCQLGFFVCCVV